MDKAPKASTEAKRYKPSKDFGLSDAQIQCRKDDNLVNYTNVNTSKSIGEIVKENALTLFNIINFILALAVFCVGSYKNLLFLGVVVCNTLIGTYQEIRAKKTIDKLSLISSTKVTALRNGELSAISTDEIVLDDILCFSCGNQIVTDCVILDGECDVNESLLTGESEAVHKKMGDTLLSGSFITSGSCKARVEHIADENYAAKISKEAKCIKKAKSEIMATLQKIIKILSFFIFPIGAFLFYNQITVDGTSYETAVVNTAAALIGMIPEGLILLTSTVLAVSVVRLAKEKVLVQELYCIETLARVDVLCLDKTGTITEGCMQVVDVFPGGSADNKTISKILCSLTAVLKDQNPTFDAIRKKYRPKLSYEVEEVVPFSSEKKWSGAYFSGNGSYLLGAPEILLAQNMTSEIEENLSHYARGNRVLVLAHAKEKLSPHAPPAGLEVVAFILLKDKIRPQAQETLSYFAEQGVVLKIISGDNVLTVSNIARQVGFSDYDNYIDATTLKNYEDIKRAVNKYAIFGRVSPAQKKQMVTALKESGHTVAMTGDGVNDVLALKEADCSVAMASGSDAARSVSQVVLLNSSFDAMPKIVAEGRRSINNVKRSASLFLTKTIYSVLLSLLFVFIPRVYPFMPIQMTLISTFTIGIPSFVLALEPNHERVSGKFFRHILQKALPCAITVVLNIVLIVLSAKVFHLSAAQISTLSVLLTAYTGFLLLYRISLPFNTLRKTLFFSMITGFVLCAVFMFEVFSFAYLPLLMLWLPAALFACATLAFQFIFKMLGN